MCIPDLNKSVFCSVRFQDSCFLDVLKSDPEGTSLISDHNNFLSIVRIYYEIKF
jgi:hypothetical protein